MFSWAKSKLVRSLRWTSAILLLTIFNWFTSREVDDWPIVFGVCLFLELLILVVQFIEISEDKPGQNNRPEPD